MDDFANMIIAGHIALANPILVPIILIHDFALVVLLCVEDAILFLMPHESDSKYRPNERRSGLMHLHLLV